MAGALNGIIGHSAVMQDLTALVLKVAPHDCSVLVHGESGTGKELIARSIQENSKRAKGPFVPLNCGAMPDALTESILFGHEKGSFTGASSDKRGLFEAANGGSIFLDEIGEMPLPAQVKLLRALQEKEIVRVGSTRHIKVDVRVIAATNRDLKSMIAEGRFRQDLYYRISTFEIQVAPLRERRADIPSLANHFLDKLSSLACHPLPLTIEEDAFNALASYDWHGNVRELENVMSRLLVVVGTSTITRADVENVLGIHPDPASIIAQTHSNARAEARRVLRPSTAELCEDETITAYMRRVKLDVLTAAITQYPNRTAAAQRLGLTKEALKRQLRYLRNATARSTTISTNNQEKV
ncbi:MAG: sigma 54-interacting transcriptional regulator [Acidobacteriota bacterium]